MAALGSFIAIVVVKQLFGGLGQNFANPAVTARIALMVNFPTAMTNWVLPFEWKNGADAVTGATPLVLRDMTPEKLAEINQENGTDYQVKDVEFNFTRATLTNETENIQNQKTEAETEQIRINTILNVAVNVGDEQALKAICDVMDWDFEEISGQIEKIQAEQEASAAKAALENVVVEDEPEPTPPGQPEEPIEE
jgi:hypothetical protein